MGLVRRFEDLEAWRQARELSRLVYGAANRAPFRLDRGLTDQTRRAAASTMNNIAEGFDSSSRTELRRFLGYAIRSASEVQSCAYIALDQRYIDDKTFNELYEQAATVRKLCRGLNRRLSSYGKTNVSSPNGVKEEPAPWHSNPRSPAHLLTRAPAHS